MKVADSDSSAGVRMLIGDQTNVTQINHEVQIQTLMVLKC